MREMMKKFIDIKYILPLIVFAVSSVRLYIDGFGWWYIFGLILSIILTLATFHEDKTQ